jgi:hypothetical protein
MFMIANYTSWLLPIILPPGKRRRSMNTPRRQLWLAEHPLFQVHYAPTGASWLNPVERVMSDVTERFKAPGRGDLLKTKAYRNSLPESRTDGERLTLLLD